MFACLSAPELRAAGWSTYDIDVALTCCLRRVRVGSYLVARQCSNPAHAFIAKIATSESVHLPKETTGMRRRDEQLRILVRSYAHDLPLGSVLSHRSALIVHGLPIPYIHSDDQIYAEVVHPRHGIRRKALLMRRRELGEADSVVVNGVPSTSAVRSLFDVARDYSPQFSVAVLDSAIRQRLLTAGQIRSYCEAHPARTRQKRIETALALMDGRRESVSESMCAVRFVEFSIPGFEPQVEIYDENGQFVARTDFTNRRAMVIVEFDGAGKYHRPGGDPRRELERERQREYKLRNLGYSVFRVRWQDLFSAEVFLRIKDRVQHSMATGR